MQGVAVETASAAKTEAETKYKAKEADLGAGRVGADFTAEAAELKTKMKVF